MGIEALARIDDRLTGRLYYLQLCTLRLGNCEPVPGAAQHEELPWKEFIQPQLAASGCIDLSPWNAATATYLQEGSTVESRLTGSFPWSTPNFCSQTTFDEIDPVQNELGKGGFVDGAARLEEAGLPDSALDIIYDRVDELLHNAEFEQCAQILDQLDETRYSTDILLALITTTFPAKSRIRTRAQFLGRVSEELRKRGENDVRLLAGLT